jgi:DNA repair/transcription protein MET18/MMS19
MFEVFSCYFPIDFQTPANEANITKESLIGLLRRCFASSTKFAKYTIPLLLDKLNSDIDSAKLDSLLTYIDCATHSYDIDTYKEYIEPLWTCFQQLTMSTTSAAIEDACLKSIECLTVSVAKCMHKEGTLLSLDSFINKCIDCTLVYLKDADLKLIWPSAKCLQAISNATSTAHLIVLKTVVKFLLDKLNECKSLSQKRTYCEILWKFVSISHKYSTKAPVHIDLNRQSLLDLCFGMVNGANDKTVWQSALCGFYNLIYFDNLIDNTELVRIFDLLMYRFAEFGSVTAVGNVDQQHGIKLIVKIIMLILNKPNGVSYDSIFNHLQQTLFQSADSLSALLILNEMSMASAHNIPILRQDTLTRVSNTIFELLLGYLAKAMATRENIDECLSICSNLIESDSMADKSFYELFGLVLSGLTVATKPNDKQHMVNLAGILNKFCVRVKTLDTHKQIVEKLDAEYGLIFGDNDVNDTDAYCGLILYMQAFGSLDNRIFKREIDEFLFRTHRKLHEFAVSERFDASVRLLATQFLSTLINKHSDDLDFLAKQILTNEFIHSLSDRIQTCSDMMSQLQMWIWLTKALVLRGHDLGNVFTSKLVEWLEWPHLSSTCSDGFMVIMKEYDHVLNRSKTNARVKLFYRQHFFEAVATKLKTQFGVCSIELKPSYVNALLTTINFLPKIILEQQLTSMLSILVFSLSNCNNDTLKLCSLKSIIDLFNNKPSQANPLDDYTDEILCHLYELAKYKPNMEIRLLAIECLVKLADLNPTHVIKYQRNVIKHLEICLDDTKRLVRQKAVVARNKWCLLSTKADA